MVCAAVFAEHHGADFFEIHSGFTFRKGVFRLKTGSRRLAALFSAITYLAVGSGLFPISVAADTDPLAESIQSTDAITDTADTARDTDTYFAYYSTVSEHTRPITQVTADGLQLSDETEEITLDGVAGVCLDTEEKWAEWTFTVEQAGAYSLYPTYYPLEDSGKDIQVSVTVDGLVPFTEAEEILLPRLWKDDIPEGVDGYEKDSLGSDIRPEQIEAPRWYTQGLRDTLGMYSEPYLFYFENGTHTVRIQCVEEKLAISQLVLENISLISYEQYIAQYSEADYAEGEATRQEAEQALEKSASTLYPTYDRSTSGTLPSDPYNTKLNIIGGSGWKQSGSFVSWTVDVPEDGLYQLAFRARQNTSEGLNAYRRLYINGEVPFAEAETLVFAYKQNWYLKTLGDDEPLLVYLKKGDVITLECTSGALAMPLREVQQAVLDLNALYRDVIMITSTSPSIYQDYDLENQLPNLVPDLVSVCDRLRVVVDAIERDLGKTSAAAATIEKSLSVFEELAEDSYFIADRLSYFKGSIESLASLLLTLGGQSLEIDCLYYLPVGAEQPKINANFFEDLGYSFMRFFYTFFNDYNSVGSATMSDKNAILVWAGVGRDQAQIINRMIEEKFTKETGIPVVLNLVTGDATLIKATLAGKGPDVSLTVASTTPVNLAARGALVDLNQFDLSELKSQTYSSAWTPFEYRGGTYAIPETQSTEFFFYRTDVFEQLGLTPPETWEDFYWMLEVLQSKNLQFGWPEINSANQGSSHAIVAFARFLFQNGGEFYNEDLTKTLFDTEAAYKAFEQTVDLYRIYGISREISFFNRFRSGDAPAGVSSYLFYTQLVASAPEIRGLWDFTLMPGTRRADGTIDHTQTGGATGCVMMSSAVERGVEDLAFQFMNWWCGAEAQSEYGKELEGILGIIGRIAPANYVALESLGWSEDELALIKTQLSQTKNNPEVLGNYTVDRSLTSALRAAINDENTPRRALAIYNKAINDEITRKRIEFKLD